MNSELPPDVTNSILQTAIKGVVAAIMAVLMWITRRQVKRVDSLEIHATQLVTRLELNAALAKLENLQTERHRANSEALGRIDERVFALWKKGAPSDD